MKINQTTKVSKGRETNFTNLFRKLINLSESNRIVSRKIFILIFVFFVFFVVKNIKYKEAYNATWRQNRS
jgi:hypothetical protein